MMSHCLPIGLKENLKPTSSDWLSSLKAPNHGFSAAWQTLLTGFSFVCGTGYGKSSLFIIEHWYELHMPLTRAPLTILVSD